MEKKMPDDYWREASTQMPPGMNAAKDIAESAFYMGVSCTVNFISSLQEYETDGERAAAFTRFVRRLDEVKEKMMAERCGRL